MRVRSIINGFDLTEGAIYNVDMEYDSVYELKCDTGTYCRNKDFFVVLPEPKPFEDLCHEDLAPYCPYMLEGMSGAPGSICEGSYCQRAYERYLEEFE